MLRVLPSWEVFLTQGIYEEDNMQEIRFDDKCKITRSTGKYNEYDEPITELVYEGACKYQEGGVSASRFITLYPLLFLPEIVMTDTNDIVEIVTNTGRKRKSLVNIARDIPMTKVPINITRVELKQATAD